jgi:hypothetical protein
MEIKLTTIKDVNDFVNLAFSKDANATLSQGRYIVNAASLLGVFSLDLMKTVHLHVPSGEYSDFQRFAA